MCKKQFKTKGIRDTGTKEEEADTVYLLAKKLPHTLVSDQNDEFKKLLKETKAEEIVRFAAAVGAADAELDETVCNTAQETQSGDPASRDDLWNCRKHQNGGKRKFSAQFKTANSEGRGNNWPQATTADKPSATIASGGGSDAVANELHKLKRSEKAKVAGLLSKTISGAEVVEIRAVSTTSVMLNACYDLEQLGKSLQLILHV